MRSYTCPICQAKHRVYHRLEAPPPMWINELTPEERAARVHETEDFMVIDGSRIFLKVSVEIFLLGQLRPFFTWDTWGEISREVIGPILPKLRGREVVSFPGTIPAITVFYGPGEDLACTFTLCPDDGRITAEVLTNSRLKEDQSQPITKERVMEILNCLHHPVRQNQSKTLDHRPFKTRFLEMLRMAKENFIDKGKQCCISLNHLPAIGLQVVSSGMLEFRADGALGFGLHLPFDDDEAALERFKAQDQLSQYHFHVWDNIPTWQRDFGMDFQGVLQAIQELISDVYCVNLEDMELEVFEM